MTQERRALLSVLEPGEFVELSRVAAAMSEQGYSALFYFARSDYSFVDRDTAICDRHGWEYIVAPRGRLAGLFRRAKPPPPKDENRGYVPPSLLKPMGRGRPTRPVLALLILLSPVLLPLAFVVNLLRGIIRLLATPARRAAGGLPADIVRMARACVSIMFSYRRAHRIIRTHRPSIITIAQDYVGSPNTILVRAGHKKGVPSVLIPFSVGTAREVAESLSRVSRHAVDQSLLSRLLVRLEPKWMHVYEGRRLVRHPAYNAFALELTGFSSDHPWVPNLTDADRIAVESEAMLEYYRWMRFADEKLVLTGSFSDDALHDAAAVAPRTKEQLFEEFGLKDRPLLVCAWPPNQFGARDASQCAFEDYEALCDFWAEALAEVRDRYEWNVMIRLHPVLNPDDMVAIARHRLPVTEADTARLVPACDLFVACVSSTIRWAVATNRPVVNFDVYRYGYTDFTEDDGVLTMEGPSDFGQALRRLCTDRVLYNAVVERQAKRTGAWGTIDGQSGRRVLNLIESLARPSDGS